MGNECQKPQKFTSATDNLNIIDTFRETLTPTELTERKSVNPIITFRTHAAPMSRLRCVTHPNLKFDTKEPPSNPSESDMTPKAPLKRQAFGFVNFSHTLKQVDKAISLKASRFILEQKNSMWDKYEVVQNLGKGAFGEVQLIRNKETKAKRALKSINKSNCQAPDSILEEIEILKKLVSSP